MLDLNLHMYICVCVIRLLISESRIRLSLFPARYDFFKTQIISLFQKITVIQTEENWKKVSSAVTYDSLMSSCSIHATGKTTGCRSNQWTMTVDARTWLPVMYLNMKR